MDCWIIINFDIAIVIIIITMRITDWAKTKLKTIKMFMVAEPTTAFALYENSELDYIDALTDGGFKVKNPNAATSCSCGESFSA